MKNYELSEDEVILLEEDVHIKEIEGNIKLTLTSKRIILERVTTNRR